jgi:microsomal dipeptidase-like Zn-dependent dipeptidase
MEATVSTDQESGLEQIHQDFTIVDMHAHPSLKVSLFNRVLTSRFRASRSFDPFGVRTDFGSLRDGGVDVLLSTVYAPEKGILCECKILRIMRYLMPCAWSRVMARPYFEVTMEMLNVMERAVEESSKGRAGKPLAKMARSVQELDDILSQAAADRPIAVIHSVEGAHSLENEQSLEGNRSLDRILDNLQRLFDRGVAYLTLAHFYKNDVVHPCFPYPESVQILGCFQGGRNLALGLTEFGERVVEKMVELGMILDISHCTPPARKRIYDIVNNRLPIIASHVGAYEVNPSPYNLKDCEIERIAETGGVVAVIFMNYWLMPHETRRGLNFIVRTIEHFVNVGGIDHVAIGSDFDGFTDPPDDLKDASQLPRLTERLMAEGYSGEEIGKIWGGNALRVLREGWGKKN